MLVLTDSVKLGSWDLVRGKKEADGCEELGAEAREQGRGSMSLFWQKKYWSVIAILRKIPGLP